jgi:transposase
MWGGRAEIRRVLYMATVAGIRSNPTLRTFYLQLRAQGQHGKQAPTACMRKLLVVVNGMLRTKTHWQAPAVAMTISTIYPLAGAVCEHGCW